MAGFRAVLPKSINPDTITAKGVSIHGGFITFDNTWTKDAAQKHLQSADRSTKMVQNIQVKAYQPSESDIQIVRSRVDAGEDVAQYGFFRCLLSDNLVDYMDERITKDVLDAMRPQAESGVTVVVNHNENIMVGSTFHGEVLPKPNHPDGFDFWVKFYIPPHKISQSGGSILQDINSGILKFVSIAFSNYATRVIETANKWIREYIYDAEQPPLLIEMSLVYRGANGRATLKKFNSNKTFNFDNIMALESTSTTLQVNGKAFNVTAAENNNAIVISVPADLDAEIKSMNESMDAIQKELRNAKEPIANSIAALQKALELPEDSVDALCNKSLTELSEMHKKYVAKDAAANKQDQIKGTQGADGDAAQADDEIFKY